MKSIQAIAGTMKPGDMKQANCEKHGDYTSSAFVTTSDTVWSGCPDCEEDRVREYEAREQRREEAERQRKTQESLRAAQIPMRFASINFTGYVAETKQQKQALSAIREYADNFNENLALGKCILLLGKVGTGKTHLACALLDRLARSGRRVRYATVRDILREIRDTWRKGSEKRESQVVEELSTVDLLVVDEVGVQFGSESEKTQLTELFDLRYRQLKPTVVISNLNKPDLEQVLGERVLDRLRDGGFVVVFDWASWRSRR